MPASTRLRAHPDHTDAAITRLDATRTGRRPSRGASAGPALEADDLLARPVQHIDVTAFDGRAVIDSYRHAAFQARNLARAADIFAEMLADRDCTVILTLAGSLVSAGLKEALLTLVECGMVDVIVATGAIVVDQDFFEALGFRHYQAPGSPDAPTLSDEELGALGIDRIYDTYIREADLQRCDEVVAETLDEMDAASYSSREVVSALGAWLDAHRPDERSLVLEAHRRGVPIFVPALSDSSAGFGVVAHRARAASRGRASVAFDSGKDFHELAAIKLAAAETGLLMVGGGVPKNFAQDAVVAARVLAEETPASGSPGHWTSRATGSRRTKHSPSSAQLGHGQPGDPARGHSSPDRGQRDVPTHKYAIQLTVADARDGGLSGSTLREATTWGKVDTAREQMVFGEATVTLPLLVSDAYHRGVWRGHRTGETSSTAASPSAAARPK